MKTPPEHVNDGGENYEIFLKAKLKWEKNQRKLLRFVNVNFEQISQA